MTFFDYWFALNTRFDEGDLTALTQLVGYKIFAIFNERRFPESLLLSDRELQSRTNIKSTQTIVEARRKLKNAGLIDFTAEQGKVTRYRLTIKQLSNSNQAVVNQLPSSNQAVESVPIIRVREDIKTLDIKTLNEKNKDARACAQAGTPVNENAEMTIHDIWEYETGYKLTGSTAYELEVLANDDFKLVHKAIVEAVKKKDTARLRYNYFKKIFDSMKNPKSIKPREGEKVERSDISNNGRPYNVPQDTGDEPWADIDVYALAGQKQAEPFAS